MAFAPGHAQSLNRPVGASAPSALVGPSLAPNSNAAQAAESVDGSAAPSASGPASEITVSQAPAQTAAQTTTSLAALVDAHRDAMAADDEGKCLATAIYFESKGEPLNGQLAVAEVLMNRAHSGRFADSLCGVVMQPSQFSFVHRGVLPAFPQQSIAGRTALAVAEIARAGLWQSGVSHAMYFHAKRVSPHWHATQIASVGHHIFYR